MIYGDVWHETATFFEDIACVRTSPDRPPGDLIDRGGRELVDTFWQALGDAVERSLRTSRGDLIVAISGGLDAAALAAAIVERGVRNVRALTVGSLGDDETNAAQQTATALGIDLEIIEPDDRVIDWPDHELWPALPRTATEVAWDQETRDATVIWGVGGDSLLRGDRHHYASRLRQGQWSAAAADIARSVVLHGCKPALGLRAALRGRRRPTLPPWLPTSLREPAATIAARRIGQADFPRGVDEMWAPAWRWFFQWMAPQHNDPPIQHRFPYFDEALVRLMATVPTAPWCVSKNLLRAALRGRIPESVRLRPKSPVTTPSKISWDSAFARELGTRLERCGYLDAGARVPGAGEFLRADVDHLLRCASAVWWRECLTARRSSRIVASEVR